MSSPTNAIRFELSPLVAPRFGIGVEIRIDGVSLIDVIRAILIDTIRRLESPWWASRSLPQPAAPYIRVPAKMALRPNRHLLGSPPTGGAGNRADGAVGSIRIEHRLLPDAPAMAVIDADA